MNWTYLMWGLELAFAGAVIFWGVRYLKRTKPAKPEPVTKD